MSRIWIIYTQELKNAFHSLLAYVLLAIFMAVSSYFFVSLIASFSMVSQQWKSIPGAPDMSFNLTEMVLTALFVNVACLALFFAPLLSMKAFSEEKKQGTLELLLTLPVRDFEVIFGKFFSAFSLYFLMILPLLLFPVLVHLVGGYFEWGTVITGFIGMILLGSAFISFGMFMSSLTDNQVISAVLTFGILIFLWMSGFAENFSELGIARWASQISFLEHFRSLAKGALEIKDVAFYVIFTSFFLFSTLISLEARVYKR